MCPTGSRVYCVPCGMHDFHYFSPWRTTIKKSGENIFWSRHFRLCFGKKIVGVNQKHNLHKKILSAFLGEIFWKKHIYISPIELYNILFFIKIGSSVFEKNLFFGFSFPLHNSWKNEILRLKFAGSFTHIGSNIWY